MDATLIMSTISSTPPRSPEWSPWSTTLASDSTCPVDALSAGAVGIGGTVCQNLTLQNGSYSITGAGDRALRTRGSCSGLTSRLLGLSWCNCLDLRWNKHFVRGPATQTTGESESGFGTRPVLQSVPASPLATPRESGSGFDAASEPVSESAVTELEAGSPIV
jgi:hypothetical protein